MVAENLAFKTLMATTSGLDRPLEKIVFSADFPETNRD